MTAKFHVEEGEKEDRDEDKTLDRRLWLSDKQGWRMLLRKSDTP